LQALPRTLPKKRRDQISWPVLIHTFFVLY
jgi:hypothetical protein